MVSFFVSKCQAFPYRYIASINIATIMGHCHVLKIWMYFFCLNKNAQMSIYKLTTAATLRDAIRMICNV